MDCHHFTIYIFIMLLLFRIQSCVGNIIFCTSFSLIVLFSRSSHLSLWFVACCIMHRNYQINQEWHCAAVCGDTREERAFYEMRDMNLCVSTVIWVSVTPHFLLSSETVLREMFVISHQAHGASSKPVCELKCSSINFSTVYSLVKKKNAVLVRDG